MLIGVRNYIAVASCPSKQHHRLDPEFDPIGPIALEAATVVEQLLN